MTYLLVVAYLAAIVAANLTTATWGAEWSIYNAFLFIGLNLTTRDKLHDLWGRNRFRNMGVLIVAGSALSYGASIWLAPDVVPSDVVARIALASAVAVSANLRVGARLLDSVGLYLPTLLIQLRYRAAGGALVGGDGFGAVHRAVRLGITTVSTYVSKASRSPSFAAALFALAHPSHPHLHTLR